MWLYLFDYPGEERIKFRDGAAELSGGAVFFGGEKLFAQGKVTFEAGIGFLQDVVFVKAYENDVLFVLAGDNDGFAIVGDFITIGFKIIPDG